MGIFLTVDEPMGPGFLIFFKKFRRSGDWIGPSLPRGLFKRDEETSRFKKIRKKAKRLSGKVTEVKKAVQVLVESEYTPDKIRSLIDTCDLVEEVTEPQFDSDYILLVIMEWYLIVQIMHNDDDEAILALMLSF